jgi:hypothetical protein
MESVSHIVKLKRFRANVFPTSDPSSIIGASNHAILANYSRQSQEEEKIDRVFRRHLANGNPLLER